MIALSIFLGFIKFATCASKDEERPHKTSDPDTCNVFNNHSNLDYKKLPPVNCQNGGGLNLFNLGLNHNNQVTKLDLFLLHDQDAGSNQPISRPVHFDYTVSNLTTFGKIPSEPQGLQLQVPISSYYPSFTLNNQQSSMNRASFIPIILSQNLINSNQKLINSNQNLVNSNQNPFNSNQNPFNSNQNLLITNPQPLPISSGQIQELQSRLIGSNPPQLDRAEEALTELVKPIHKVGMDLGDHKVNNGESKQSLTEKKHRSTPWKACELNNLLKGVNKCGTRWKRILNLYQFGKGRTNKHLRHKFYNLEQRGKIVYTKDCGWKFVNRGELIDSVRAEGENEQIQREKESQRASELVNNRDDDDLNRAGQHRADDVIENSGQEQDQEGPLFVGANKKKRWVPWEDYELTNLINGVNTYGNDWKNIYKSFKFEQGRTPDQLAWRFSKLKKYDQATFTEDFGWKLVNENDSTNLGKNEPSKAAENQVQGKGQKQKRLFFTEKARKSRKNRYLSWKKREVDNLLKGVNKYGRSWKKILDSYEFKKERTNMHLYSMFRALEKRGRITYEEKFGWKYTDLYREKLGNKVIFEQVTRGPFTDEKTH